MNLNSVRLIGKLSNEPVLCKLPSGRHICLPILETVVNSESSLHKLVIDEDRALCFSQKMKEGDLLYIEGSLSSQGLSSEPKVIVSRFLLLDNDCCSD